MDQQARTAENHEIKYHEDLLKMQEQNFKVTYERDHFKEKASTLESNIKQLDKEVEFYKDRGQNRNLTRSDMGLDIQVKRPKS